MKKIKALETDGLVTEVTGYCKPLKDIAVVMKRGGRILSETKVKEGLSKGGIILSAGEMAMPMPWLDFIHCTFRVKSKKHLSCYGDSIRSILSGNYALEDILFVLMKGTVDISLAYSLYLKETEYAGYRSSKMRFYAQCRGKKKLEQETVEAIAYTVRLMVEGPTKYNF